MVGPTRFTPYQRRLFVFLGVATFFEGYDFLALTQLLPTLIREFGLRRLGAGSLVAVANVGTVLAFFLVSRADRWGRKRVLTVTILGYTLFTLLSGLATNVVFFALCQLVARIFLLAEWAVSMVIAAEEFGASDRGMVIGVVQACSSLGAVVCAAVVPFLLETRLGWRAVYFVGVVPLLLLALARRGLRETERFAATEQAATRRPFTAILRGPYRRRVLVMASIWFFAYIASQNSLQFWKTFAVDEVHLTERQAGSAIALAALVSMPLIFYSGRMIDLIGRRRGAAVVFLVASAATAGCYLLRSYWALTGALVLGVYSVSAYLPILNSYTTELFPTELRGDAFAWSNNLLGRISYVTSPAIVGALASRFGGFGPVVAATALFPLVALALVYAFLPETRSRELEDTSEIH